MQCPQSSHQSLFLSIILKGTLCLYLTLQCLTWVNGWLTKSKTINPIINNWHVFPVIMKKWKYPTKWKSCISNTVAIVVERGFYQNFLAMV